MIYKKFFLPTLCKILEVPNSTYDWLMLLHYLQILSWELVIGLTKACVALGFLAAYKPLGRLAAVVMLCACPAMLGMLTAFLPL
jgi:hypothetical protein